MYILKITNTIKNRDDLFVYDDQDVDFASLVQTFTDEALESIIKATLNEDLPITDKTFRKCARYIDSITDDIYVEAGIMEFLNRIYTSPADIFEEVKELIICSNEDDFEPIGEEFVENGSGSGIVEPFTYHFSWVIYDDNTYDYELFFRVGTKHTIDIALKHKDGFDIPPSELSLT